MTTTAVYDAQDALLALVKGLDSVGGWKVDLGFPPGAVQTKHIWVDGNLADNEQMFGLSGLAAKDENFTLRVHIVATAKANTYDVPRDRVKTITDELGDAISADFRLGDVVELAQVTGVELDEGIPDDASRQVMATVAVACRAWLT